MTLSQAELTTEAVASSALKFPLSSSRAQSSLNLGVTGGSPRTVSFWVKTDRPLGSYGDVIGWGPAHQGMTNRTGFQMVLLDRAGGEVVVWSDYGDRSASGIGNPFTGRFEMVTYVYSDSISGAKIYVGGQSIPIGQGGHL
ncbi:hypothetical protein EBS57_06310 [bacterium]|nr:hypothetical protein [bacterium]